MLHQFANLPTSYLLMSFAFAIFSGLVGFFIGHLRGILMCQTLLKKVVDANVCWRSRKTPRGEPFAIEPQPESPTAAPKRRRGPSSSSTS